MSEQPTESPDAPADLGPGTDVTADLDELGEHETPASSDPDEFRDDPDLGGTHGPSSGGAG